MRKKPGVRERLRQAEAGLQAAVWLLGTLRPKGAEEAVEEVIGLLTAAVAAEDVTTAGCARLLREMGKAGWQEEVEVDAERWVEELVERIERGEESIS